MNNQSKHYQMYIDGKWCDGKNGECIVINPATEEVLWSVAYGGSQEAMLALDAATQAFSHWRCISAWQRANFGQSISRVLSNRINDIAQIITLEQGKTFKQSIEEVNRSIETFEWFAEEAKRLEGRIILGTDYAKQHFVICQPIGLVGAIVPWNFPVMLASRKIAPAIMAGCTIVIKPSKYTPRSLIALFECIHEAGLPHGVANLVIGDNSEITKEFFSHRACKKVSFTGSTNVGQELILASAKQVTKLNLELGGNSPFIVYDDVNVKKVAYTAIMHKLKNSGQVCTSPNRFFIHKNIKQEFLSHCLEIIKNISLGNGLSEDVDVGPLINLNAVIHAENLVSDAVDYGAKVIYGGKRCMKFKHGFFFEPTILDMTHLPIYLSDKKQLDNKSEQQMSIKTNHIIRNPLYAKTKILNEEIFAPIMLLLEFDDLDTLCYAINDTEYGLAGYLFTNSLDKMIKISQEIECGILGINDIVASSTQCPFGGIKSSGIGKELSKEGIEAYLDRKTINVLSNF